MPLLCCFSPFSKQHDERMQQWGAKESKGWEAFPHSKVHKRTCERWDPSILSHSHPVFTGNVSDKSIWSGLCSSMPAWLHPHGASGNSNQPRSFGFLHASQTVPLGNDHPPGYTEPLFLFFQVTLPQGNDCKAGQTKAGKADWTIPALVCWEHISDCSKTHELSVLSVLDRAARLSQELG